MQTGPWGTETHLDDFNGATTVTVENNGHEHRLGAQCASDADAAGTDGLSVTDLVLTM